MTGDIPLDPGGRLLDGSWWAALHRVDGEVPDHPSDMNEFVMRIPVSVVVSVNEFEDCIRTREQFGVAAVAKQLDCSQRRDRSPGILVQSCEETLVSGGEIIERAVPMDAKPSAPTWSERPSFAFELFCRRLDETCVSDDLVYAPSETMD